jgi:hypothetical protein
LNRPTQRPNCARWIAIAGLVLANVSTTLAASTTRISVASDGTRGNGGSDLIMTRSISTEGRSVAFASGASNLVAADTNNADDVFV